MTITKKVNGYEVRIKNVPTNAKRYIIATDLKYIDDMTDEVNYTLSFESKNNAYEQLIKMNMKREKQYHIYF